MQCMHNGIRQELHGGQRRLRESSRQHARVGQCARKLLLCPRENCIAPPIVFIVWTTDTTNGRGLAPDMRPHVVAIPPQKREAAHTGGTQEGCVWAGTVVIDLRVPTGREGGRRGGRGRESVGVHP